MQLTNPVNFYGPPPARVSLDRILAAAGGESSARGYAGARVDLKAFRKVHPLAAYFSMLPPIVVYLVGAPIRREMTAQHPADIASPTPDAFVQHVQETMHHALACGATAESRPSACTPRRNPLTAPKFPLAIVPAACDGCGPARSAADAQFRLRRAGARPEDPRHAQAELAMTQSESRAADAELGAAQIDVDRFEVLLSIELRFPQAARRCGLMPTSSFTLL